MIELSILIATMPTRYPMLARLLREINHQIEHLDVADQIEVLTNDSMAINTGVKRNYLYQKAQGKYSVSIDDDDSIYPWYIEEILKAAKQDPDAIGINGIMTTNGRYEQNWFISKDNDYCARQRFDGSTVYERFHNHISPIRSEIAKQFIFPDQTIGEDYIFAKSVHESGLIKTEVHVGTKLNDWLTDTMCRAIIKPMYHYRYLTNKPQIRK